MSRRTIPPPAAPAPAVSFRAGRPDDAEAIAALIASFQQDITDRPDARGAEPYLAAVSATAQRGHLESARYCYIVAEDGGALVGFIALRDATHVFHLFVARARQRQGLARELWERARKATAGAGAANAAYTVNSSLGAVATYRAFGFEPVGDVTSMHGISFVPMRLGAGPV